MASRGSLNRSVLEARNRLMAVPSPKQGVLTKKTQVTVNNMKLNGLKTSHQIRNRRLSATVQSPILNKRSPRIERPLTNQILNHRKVRNRKKKGKDD